MTLICPKCKSDNIFKRKCVPRYETHTNKFVRGLLTKVKKDDAKFYVCYECHHKFNIE